MSKVENAKAEDCHAGYRVYYAERLAGANHPTADLAAFHWLHDHGRFPLPAKRTSDNWRRQWNKGVHPDNYFPVNRWDFRDGIPEQFQDPSRDN